MKRGTLVPVLLVLTLCAGGLARAEEPVKTELDTSFALSVGETARLEPEGFEVTLRSMSDDSGCDDPKACSTLLFKGTILTRLGEKKDLAQITAMFEPGKVFTLDFEGYQVQLSDIRRPKDKGALYASFRVVKLPPESEKKD
ncbi:MAG TPA: hypothetical protein VGG20_05115 [Thermoanaerobaculia bacterium]|jgi:hypothetical protein